MGCVRPLPVSRGSRVASSSNAFRPCRFSRLRRFSPRTALRVYCAPQPIMGFTWFWASQQTCACSQPSSQVCGPSECVLSGVGVPVTRAPPSPPLDVGLRPCRRPRGFVPPESSRSVPALPPARSLGTPMGFARPLAFTPVWFPRQAPHGKPWGPRTRRCVPAQQPSQRTLARLEVVVETTTPVGVVQPKLRARRRRRSRRTAPPFQEGHHRSGQPVKAAPCGPSRVHSPGHLTEVLVETRRYPAGVGRVFGTFKDHTG